MNAAAEGQQLLLDARQVVQSEAEALGTLVNRLDDAVPRAIELIYAHTGPDKPGILVVSGIGKSGLAGQRISASFASTGTPSHFLHPVEALHGDLGRVRRGDIMLMLSYGGETQELLRLTDSVKRSAVTTIAITSSRKSSLGRLADITIELGNIEEACPLRLAPTTSIACMSAAADALVLGVMGKRNFSAADFAAFHPAGSLGRKLLRVVDVMSFRAGENLVVVREEQTLREALSIEHAVGRRAGALVIINHQGLLSGILTDADIRRRIATQETILDVPVAGFMTRSPKRINPDRLASEALELMNRHRIDELPVVDESGRPVGMIDVQDIVSLQIAD